MDIQGKTALVTGGGVRVGRAITLGLAEAGADVIVHYNTSQASARETVADARELGVEAIAVQADLTDPENVRPVVQVAQERLGGIDILVHAASPFVATSLFDVTLHTWRELMAVLVESFLIMTQGLVPGMIKRGEGVIVTILDRGAFEPWPDFLAHGVAKSALWALTRSLAVELAPVIRVNAVVPGPVLPPPGYTPEQRERGARGTLLQRWGTPGDVVDAVLFLIRADYVIGEPLFVDGGERWVHRRTRKDSWADLS
jgi:pteridine reductase